MTYIPIITCLFPGRRFPLIFSPIKPHQPLRSPPKPQPHCCHNQHHQPFPPQDLCISQGRHLDHRPQLYIEQSPQQKSYHTSTGNLLSKTPPQAARPELPPPNQQNIYMFIQKLFTAKSRLKLSLHLCELPLEHPVDHCRCPTSICKHFGWEQSTTPGVVTFDITTNRA